MNAKDNNYELNHLLIQLSNDPDNVDILNNLGIYYAKNNNLNDAIRAFQKGLRIDDTNPTLLYNLGNVYKKRLQYKQAIRLYHRAISLDSQLYQAFFQIGNIHMEQEGFYEASIYFKKAIDINPSFKEAICNLGVCYYRMCLLSEAIQKFEEALDIDNDYADAHYNLALALFMIGDYKTAFREYEWRFKTDLLKPFNPKNSFWDGKLTKGLRLHVACEQGYGDMIQFIRFINILCERSITVSVQCPLQLLSIFSNSFKRAKFSVNEEENYDYFIPLMSIPHIIGIELDNIPKDVPYIFVSPTVVESWAKRINNSNGLLKVGICWSGSRNNTRGRYRSIPADMLKSLLSINDVVFYSLMKERVDNIALFDANIHDFTGDFYDFEQTAGLIANLDLVISIDTAVAHLAGAMGKLVWLMLHYSSDWRWMLHRTDSPWYPTMKIFRQYELGNWEGVLRQIKQELLIELSKRQKEKINYASCISQQRDDFSISTKLVTLMEKARHFMSLKRYDEAISCLESVLRINPDLIEAHWELSLLLLKQRNLKEGWRHYEWRKMLPETRDFYKHPKVLEFDGRIVKGKRILVYDEQGFGDAIQFIRFVNKLIEGEMSVTILCRDELVRLFRQFIGLKDVIPRSKPYGEYDCIVSIMSLPYILGLDKDDLYINTPYFYLPYKDVNEWNSALSDKMNIGFVLTGRQTHKNDSQRSMDISTFEPVLNIGNINFLNLDKNVQYNRREINDIAINFRDFYDTACLIQNLNLVITVDTAVAHLSGALNKEVWVMLPFHSDWRWFDEDEKTIWYPSMRLFRQREDGDWNSVVEKIRNELLKRVK